MTQNEHFTDCDESEDVDEEEQTTLDDRSTRDLRAKTDVGAVKECPDGSYNVISANSGNVYTVTLEPATCECPDHQYRDAECKHIRAVQRQQ